MNKTTKVLFLFYTQCCAVILVPRRFLRSTAMACCSAHAHLVTRQHVLNAGVRPSFPSARTKKNRDPTVSNCRPPARPTTSAGRKQQAFKMYLRSPGRCEPGTPWFVMDTFTLMSVRNQLIHTQVKG